MAKLYFRYGAVSSAKTMNLLAVAYNYRQQGKKVLLVKPAVDVRFGCALIKSRAGLEQHADVVVDARVPIPLHALAGVSCVLVDEAQFLSVRLINQLRDISAQHDIPVICYGLRADFRSHLFEGSKRLLELADTIEEVKTTCAFCNRKAVMNLKHSDGRATIEGPSVDLGAEEKYFPACYGCYHRQLEIADSPLFPTSEQFELFTRAGEV
jgi:thymidine kinase